MFLTSFCALVLSRAQNGTARGLWQTRIVERMQFPRRAAAIQQSGTWRRFHIRKNFILTASIQPVEELTGIAAETRPHAPLRAVKPYRAQSFWNGIVRDPAGG
jgi:hypothetical protein